MSPHVTWPADHFYWAVVEAPGVRRTGELPAGLLPMLEEDVPTEAADLHAVCVPVSGGRLAICAAERAFLANIHAETITLTPGSLPHFIQSLNLTPAQFNLLVGSFEPMPTRWRRVRQHAYAAAIVLLCGALIALGLHRRASRWDERAESARVVAANIASTLTPSGSPNDLAAEAARLQSTHDAFAKLKPPADAPLALAAVLQAWPTSVPSKPQTISIGQSGISISTSVEGDAAAFLKAFSPPPGFTLDEPRLNASDKLTRLSLQLRPSGARP
jgi:hypothetical protein